MQSSRESEEGTSHAVVSMKGGREKEIEGGGGGAGKRDKSDNYTYSISTMVIMFTRIEPPTVTMVTRVAAHGYHGYEDCCP